MGTIALEVDWASLHKILSDTTRRSILELLAERESLTYTDMMTVLQITNTGRLNYHLKALGNLISKDEEGRYHLTDPGRQAASLLKTFPERVSPERKLSALKIIAAVVLILIGISFIIATFAYALFFVATTPTFVSSNYASVGTQALPQNTTVYLTGWTLSGSSFSMAWSAAGPVHIYVLNHTQYNALQLSHLTGAQSSRVLYNFTGSPGSWAEQYYKQSGNVSVSLPLGLYHFYAWSSSANYLDSFGLSQAQTEAGGTSFSPFLILYESVFLAIGALLIVLAASILTHRVWR